MTYQETLNFLFNKRPAFERQGAAGYKPGLGTAQALDEWLGHPHRSYPTVHVAGTNGKGSVSHLLAAAMQCSGRRTGLFTSPHFVDFRERIRVNGEPIPEREVVAFVERYLAMQSSASNQAAQCEPSFFELTSAMALDWFARCEVDVAIIEVGLGGRLDSTNIITPALSVITNISLDHTDFLGDTIEQVAAEKAGIIKPGVPAVVGEADAAVRRVMERKAASCGAPLTFAQDYAPVTASWHDGASLMLATRRRGTLRCQLTGDYQVANAATALTAIDVLAGRGLAVSDDAVAEAFAHVATLTGLRGRWTRLAGSPAVIADSAHNAAGITAAMAQLRREPHSRLHMVVGFMADKDLANILPLLPIEGTYYFTQAQSARALPAGDLQALALPLGLHGTTHATVADALNAAQAAASRDDLIYVGGSMYVLAELFEALDSGTITLVK